MPIELGKDERRAVAQQVRTAVLDAVRALGGEATRRDILDRALQAGDFAESRLAWELSNLKRDGLLDNPQRGIWRLTDAGAKRPEPLVRVRVSLDRLRELREMPHAEYLETAEWRRTRDAVLERAGHRCSRDRRHKQQLDVHHAIRVRIGAELPSDLVVLCRTCFEQHHGGRREDIDAAEVVEGVSVAPPTLSVVAQASAPAPADEAEGDRSLLRRILRRAS